ncbi:tautomerase family protein [Chelativorans sp. YIM 93263]|uniref:tautomerase family protein n=1 Tax=Chelativorans sp. YIM 93263 TaxID=2906648 RepID=UPI002379441B|nr:2-hydroxymuconate tautomerase family protein [Chelativorans sp. YIM 93263]
MPIIRVEMFEGRSEEQKTGLVRELTDGFVRSCGGNPASVQVVISEYSPENWGSAGTLVSQKSKGS